MRKNIMRGTGGRSFPDGGSQFGRNFDLYFQPPKTNYIVKLLRSQIDYIVNFPAQKIYFGQKKLSIFTPQKSIYFLKIYLCSKNLSIQGF